MQALRAFGVAEATIEQARSELLTRARQQQLAVLPENWCAVHLFDALQTQWVRTAEGRYTGISYPSVPLVLRSLRGLPHWRPLAEVLPQLLAMELAALPIMNKG